MADIIHLPNAAAEPVVNVRRRGAYPKKIKPLWRQRLVRARREHEAAAAALQEQTESGRILIEPSADVRWNCSVSGLYRYDYQRAIDDLRAIADHIEAKYGLDPHPRCAVLSLVTGRGVMADDRPDCRNGEKS
ncbi:hypothetical protein [Cupriavidus plantarum]|uniref:hypothetical protein n=1 Tax=Cupriavidus plantarum TaxID=942865 RepID=UPI000EB0C671|nr:hypothetical protein [Cupriavidus plantarum]RLK36115.1 hypothetical protein C7417_3891 [Cupriavidus plantarum]